MLYKYAFAIRTKGEDELEERVIAAPSLEEATKIIESMNVLVDGEVSLDSVNIIGYAEYGIPIRLMTLNPIMVNTTLGGVVGISGRSGKDLKIDIGCTHPHGEQLHVKLDGAVEVKKPSDG